MSSGASPDATRPMDKDLRDLTASEIVSAMAAADGRALSRLIGELMRRFEPLTRRIWSSVRGGPSDYDDYRQAVWIKLLGVLPRLETPEAFAGFFRQIALNCARDELRSARRRESVVVPMDDEDRPDIAVDELDEIDSAILVRSFLEALPPRERAVLELLFDRELGTPEVARALGLSEGTVRMTKSRGIKRLRGLVQSGAAGVTKKSGSDDAF